MKKILIFLFVSISTLISATYDKQTFDNFVFGNGNPNLISIVSGSSTPYSCNSGTISTIYDGSYTASYGHVIYKKTVRTCSSDGNTLASVIYTYDPLSIPSGTPENLCPTNYTTDNNDNIYFCDGGNYTVLNNPDNGYYSLNDDIPQINCNDGYRNVNGTCLQEETDGNGYYDPDNGLTCDDGYDNLGNDMCTANPCGSGSVQTGTNLDGSPICYADTDQNGEPDIFEPQVNEDGTTDTLLPDGTEQTEYPDNTTVTNNPDGTTTTTLPDGSSTTTYSDGTSTYTPPSNGGTDSISGGNTGGGTGGGTEDTSGELDTDNGYNDVNIIDDTTCEDENLTLQEKMLCEINNGTKKLNSESDPTNSLNNLFKDLRDNQQIDNTAINQNLKDIESLNKDLKSLNLNQLSTLNAIKTAQVSTAGSVSELVTGFQDSTAENVENPLSTVGTDFDSFTSSFTGLNDSYTSLNTQIVDKFNEVKISIQEGFNFTLNSHEIVTCPLNYTLDLSSVGMNNFDLNIDICYYTSQLKPYLYPLLFIMFSLGFTMTIFKMLRGI
jgi:hypothetical protein